MTDQSVVKWQVKASIFTDLFSIPEYQLKLYQALHPEDMEVTEGNISNVRLQTVLVNDLYNDAGMIVKDKLLILVEAQSTWSENILIRELMYAVQSLNDYFKENNVNLYSSVRVTIPKPEFYVVFTGKRTKRPSTLSFKKTFFPDEPCALEVKAKVFYNGKKGDIIQQYVTFAHVWDEQFKKYGRAKKALEETIRICTKRGALVDYLKKRRKELMDIMTALFDQEEVLRRYHLEIRNDAKNEGKIEGKIEDIRTIMKKLKCSAVQAMDYLDIPMDERKEMLKKLEP